MNNEILWLVRLGLDQNLFTQAQAQTVHNAVGDSGGLMDFAQKLIDDLLHHAVWKDGLRQVVLLAAGLDARAFRFDWPSDLRWFEIDRGEIFDHKESVLASMNASATCDRKIVRADLERDWITPLTAAGFDRSRPAFFVVEGLVMGAMAHIRHMHEDDNAALFAEICAEAMRNDAVETTCMKNMAEAQAMFANYIGSARERGEIDPPVELDVLLPTLMSIAHGMALNDLPAMGVPLEKLEVLLRAMVVGMLRPTGAKRC